MNYRLFKLRNTENKGRILFHGSEGGIIGRPKCNVNKGLCDFGSGFYTGDNLNQAENRVSNRRDSIVYAYKYDLRKCRVYEFNSVILLALFVGYNRSILSDIPNELLSKFEFINSHDVIIGYIADDKISAVYNDFLSSNITDVCLAECLKLVRYDKQVVFKTNHSLECIELYSTYTLTKEMKKNSIDWGRGIKSNMEKDLEKYKLKYRRIGRYLDEILEET